MAQVSVVKARTRDRLEQAFAIRRAVFVVEQGVAEALEFDRFDGEAKHLLALLDDRPVGTLRLRTLVAGRIAKIERVAVLPDARGRDVGHALMEAGLALADAAAADEVRVHAQTYATGFYQRFGFTACGAEFIEDGLPHVAMRRLRSDPPDEAAVSHGGPPRRSRRRARAT